MIKNILKYLYLSIFFLLNLVSLKVHSQIIDKCFRTIEPNINPFRHINQDEKVYKKYLRNGLPGNEYIYGYFQKFVVSNGVTTAIGDSVFSNSRIIIDSNEFEGLNKINLVYTGDLVKFKGTYDRYSSGMIPVSIRKIKDSVASFVSFRLDTKNILNKKWIIYYKKRINLEMPFKMYIHLGKDKTNEKLKYVVTLPPATEYGKIYSYTLDFNTMKIDKRYRWLCIGFTGSGFIYSECDMNQYNESKVLND